MHWFGVQSQNAQRCRRGVTLIELLIVVGVLTILATLSLSTVKGLLKDQKVTQAARLVEQYFETAKVRAITNGRPVAVFLERASVAGDPSIPDVVVPENYYATRLSIGEVFPPYTGDVLGATGTLWDIDMTSNSAGGNSPTAPDIAARGPDGFADQIRFTPADVFSGFGTPPAGAGGTTFPGMVAVGDLIEFSGSPQRFLIERIDWVAVTGGGLQVAVTFFNPPAPFAYNQTLLTNNVAPPQVLVPGYSTQEPRLPTGNPAVTNAELAGLGAPTPTVGTAAPPTVGFRIYRQPTKSMVGSITLPRGTCVDLYASGIGSSGSSADGDLSPFFPRSGHPSLAGFPPGYIPDGSGGSIPPTPGSFSRVAIVFDGTGKPTGLFRSDKIINSASGAALPNGFYAFGMDSLVYLLVGRTGQVTIAGTDRYSRPTDGEDGLQLSNALDPANSWIMLNPLTGLVSSSPVAAVSEFDRAAAVASDDYGALVSASRALANVGVNDARQ